MNFLLERSMDMKKNMEVLITNSRGIIGKKLNRNSITLFYLLKPDTRSLKQKIKNLITLILNY